jgi:hypothetical protein
MSKQKKYEFNQQFATLRLREEITKPLFEGRVMFTIDDEDVDQLFTNQFEADVDYIHDGPDVYYVTDQNDLERFVDYVESSGLDADAIKVQQYFKEEGAVTGGEGYLPSMNVSSKKQNPFKEDALSGYTQDKNFRPGHTADKGGFQYKDLWGLNEAETVNLKEHKMIIIKEMNQIVDEVFSREDYKKVLSVIEKIKYTNTKLYNAILDMLIDNYLHSYEEVEAQMGLSENYSRFKNETKTRTSPEQFHQAVKSVKRKVEEIHKLYEYMERLQKELSEGSDGLKYKKYTENAMQKIKEAVKTLHIKTKKLK